MAKRARYQSWLILGVTLALLAVFFSLILTVPKFRDWILILTNRDKEVSVIGAILFVLGLVYRIYKYCLRLIVPTGSQAHQEPAVSLQRPKGNLSDIFSERWRIVATFAICPMVAITVANGLGYVTGRSPPPFSQLPWNVLIEAACSFPLILAIVPLVVILEYHLAGLRRLFYPILCWAIFSEIVELITASGDDYRRKVKGFGLAGGIVAGIVNWFIFRGAYGGDSSKCKTPTDER